MTQQRIASIARQGLALLGVIMGVLTASVSQLHLPVAVSAAITVGGAVLLAVEHFVSDPSTGTPISTITTTTSTAAPKPVVVQPAPVPQVPQ